ncbi:DUF4919 domain-containing protein [Flavobacterium alkalisoli]|uniref:DUF4919 domain-containing protein n=1 Tax=Flavobacterium alkalisoli TaxID=2602769 RepID=A0A5B9FXM3_9FLAO|nr:DUF4919 domain-containing protein [Flavobacterium alkalisoli]QEE51129.1 DUF4919 domain-containing protein [Flavobacterium alkalisoli]
MKLLYSLLILFLTQSFYAQDFELKKPDFDLIEKNVKDKNSPYYFDKLYARYIVADSTMTLEERRHLYFGYSFQDEYAPYERSDAQQDLNKILQQEEFTKQDYQDILTLSSKILKIYPFSIRMMEYRIFVYKELEQYDDAIKQTVQANIILDAILSTGEGTSKESSFYVINVMNEYELLNILGFEYGGQQELVDGLYDYLTLKENSYYIDGLYFEVSRCLNSLKF